MNGDRVIETAFNSLERFLRWIYPGLLFALILPLTFKNVRDFDQYWGTLSEISGWAGAVMIIAGGFLVYLIERYLLHELCLVWGFLYRFGVAPSANFKGTGPKLWYPKATAPLMWIRFGKRPFDDKGFGDGAIPGLGERAESRFDNYMANRMASVHALGCTWVIFLGMFLVGKYLASASLSKCWSGWSVLIILPFMVAWVLHAVIAARAEQAHYKQPLGEESK